jgi:hypothetical protein
MSKFSGTFASICDLDKFGNEKDKIAKAKILY